MPNADTGRLLSEVKSLIGASDWDSIPDGQLLARFVEERDEAAFERLVRRYGRLVFGVCRRVLADPHTAEDAFQATFLVLVHKARSLDRGRPVGDWLYTVAFRLACRARSNAVRRREKETQAAQGRSIASDPPAIDDTIPILHEELNRLPERHRVPLVLSYLEGRTYEQVAQAIGCPLGTVGWRLERAKEALRDRLTHRGVACTVVSVGTLLTAATAGAAAPAPLVDTTIRVGFWFAGDRALGGVATSANAVALARGAMGAMGTSKWIMAASVLLTVGLGGGTAWLAAMTDPPRSPEPKRVEPAAATKASDLPSGAIARLGSSQFRHGEAVHFIAYTPDGKHMVTAGRDQAIRLWDRATGMPVRSFEMSAKPKLDLEPKKAMEAMPGKMMRGGVPDSPLALSPDGKWLAAGRGPAVTVWDVATAKIVHELTAEGAVFELVFSTDSKNLIGADSNQGVTLWDAASGKVAKTHKVKQPQEGGPTIKTGAAVSPAGTHFVQQFLETGTGNAELRVFDLAAGDAGREIKLAVGGAQNITFSPDGKLLAWSSITDGVTVWNVAEHKEVGRFGREGMKVKLFGNSIRIAEDGKTLAVTLANDAIELWDIEKQKLLRTLSGYKTEPSHRVAVRIAVGANDRMTRNDLAFSPDGKVVAASLGNATVRQFDTETGNEIAQSPGHMSGVVAVGSAERQVVSVSKESVRVWDAASGREIRQWPLSPPAVAAAVSADGRRVATASGSGVVRLWDTANGEKIREIDTKRTDVAGLGFSPDGKLLATKAELNAAVNLWDAATGNHVRTIGQDGEPTLSGGRVMLDYSGVQTPAIVFSADGRLVAAAGDKKQLGVWDVATGGTICEIATPASSIGVAFAFSANGHVISLLTNGSLVAGYEVATGEKRYEFKSAEGGSTPAAGFPGTTAMTVSSFSRGNAAGGGIGFSADGRYIVVSGAGSAIRIVDTLTGEDAGELKGHHGSVSTLRVSTDGRSLVSGSVDTTAMVWDLGQLSRIELSRENPLTADEIEALWGDLAKSDAKTAFVATRKLLTDRDQAVKLLKDRLRPVPKVEESRIAQLVSDLGGAFAARRKAAEELERLGEQALPQLRKALDGNPPLELKQRLERLVEKANVQKPDGDRLRELRAIEVLQLAGTPEAKKVLQSLAAGAPSARLTREATSALTRMVK